MDHTQTLDNTGRLTISGEAQAELGLASGVRMLEMVVNGLLVFMPVDNDVLEAFDAVERLAAERGVTAEELIADIEREHVREMNAEPVTRGPR